MAFIARSFGAEQSLVMKIYFAFSPLPKSTPKSDETVMV
jgi:hypothetical protein